MSYLTYTTAKGVQYFKIVQNYRVKGEKNVNHRVLLNIGPIDKLMKLFMELWEKQSKKTDENANAPPDDATSGGAPPETHEGVENGSGSGKSDDILSEPSVDKIDVKIHGAPLALYKIAEECGVVDILNASFPGQTRDGCTRGESILLAAIHRACDPGSKVEFSDWFSRTTLPECLELDPVKFGSQHFWDQMHGIDIEMLHSAEDKIVKRVMEMFPERAKEIKELALDYTNYYTYISSVNVHCRIAQRGKNKQGRDDLRQISIAVVTSPVLGIPMATFVYEGNLNDKQAFKKFMESFNKRSKELGLDSCMLVFDGGSIGEENLKLVTGKYISRGSLSSKDLKDLLDVKLSKFEEITLEDGKKVKVYESTKDYMGGKKKVVVILSDELKAGQIADLDNKTKKLQDNIADLNSMLEKSTSKIDKKLSAIKRRVKGFLSTAHCHFNEFVTIQYSTEKVRDPEILKAFEKRQSLKRPPKKINPLLNGINSVDDIPMIEVVTKVSITIEEEKKSGVIDKYFGKNCLFSNDLEITKEKMVSNYRKQEAIEDIFRDTKNRHHLSLQPVYHWTESNVIVHFFTCYLSLTLTRVLMLKLKDDGMTISADKLLDRLNLVYMCHVLIAYRTKKNPTAIKVERKIAEMSDAVASTWSRACKVLKMDKDGKPLAERKDG